jgi:predicted phosphodiesterase
MEHQLNIRFAIIASIVLTLSSCTKQEDTAVTANERFSQSLDWNNTHSSREITVQSDDYLIQSMGDSHVGETKNLDIFFNIAKSNGATAVVMAGDLTTGHENDYSEFERHLPSPDSLPVFLTAGNHDLFFNGWREFYARFGSSSYSFTIKTPKAMDLYICLETGGGTLGNKQLDWLINLFETKRLDYRHCIVFTHNNFFRTRHTDSTNPPVEEIQVLLELFVKYHVDMAIAGHDHKQDSEVFGNTTYIIMDALKDGESNAGYFQIRVKNGNITYEFENF